MEFYYYNKNTDDKGNHEVHTENCTFIPALQNRVLIGYEGDCKAAITRAVKDTNLTNFDGCYYCCNACHTG